MSAKTGNETLTERVNKLEQIMSKLTNDLQEIHTEIDCAMPKGSIIIWSGSFDDIPKGWQLCDGSDGGPNLGDKFIVGASGSLGTRQTGGSKFHDHVSATYNSVNH